MPSSPTPRRRRCERCLRPVSHCLCEHISVIENQTCVLILQHPDEARHPLNTARLAVQGLRYADLLVGETFPELSEFLAPFGSVFLLFPDNGDGLAPDARQASHITACKPDEARLLVVPDGTWRKARQIISNNPLLQSLPRLSLSAAQPSQYKVRKAREPGALATIEAISEALVALEPQQDFQPLLKPFHVLVDQQIQAMGPQVYERNHAGKEVS